MEIKEFVKYLIKNLIALNYLFELQRGNDIKDLFNYKKIFYLLRGYSTEKNKIYNFNKNNYKFYLSDFSRKKTMWINHNYRAVLDNKVIFEKVFFQKEICAKTYGEIKNGIIFFESNKINFEEFIEKLKLEEKIILKPLSGGGGKGIKILTYTNQKLIINEIELSFNELKNLIDSLNNYIICEYIKNGSYINNIFMKTTNTIRIVTIIDSETNEPFIATAIQRIGSSRTYPVDNVWNGGYTSKVNLETGILGRCAYHTNKNKTIEWDKFHMDTGKKIEGVKIENWELVKKQIINLAKEFDYIKYIGWDVVVTDTGIRIIEANNYSDVNFLQIHEPLLKDERIRRFYIENNII